MDQLDALLSLTVINSWAALKKCTFLAPQLSLSVQCNHLHDPAGGDRKGEVVDLTLMLEVPTSLSINLWNLNKPS